jgi:hypothetical protein
MPKACFKPPNKSYCSILSNAQIESIKGNAQISPYTTYSTYSGYISEIAATEGSYVMEGGAIIKLAVSPFGLKLK